MFSNRYIFIYSSIMVVVVAIALTVVAVSLKPLQEANVRIEKMQNILKAINVPATPKDAEKLYNKYIVKSFTLKADMTVDPGVNAFNVDLGAELKKPNPADRLYPVYVAALDNGDTSYIFPMRGKGLWGPIWGYIALKNDFNTIYGVMFDHKGETPGLGAEINTDKFQQEFFGKTIFDENGNFTSVKTIKGGAGPNNPHGVDAISGGTITSNGLSDMIHDGFTAYLPFLQKKIKQLNTQSSEGGSQL